MRRLFCMLASASMLVTIANTAQAASIIYRISGTGSGTIAGVAFNNAAYSITLNGDTANVRNFGAFTANDPLISAVLGVSGFAPATLGIATRIGVTNTGAVAFFSRAGNNADLLDFTLSVRPDLAASFGPLVGRGVFALNQFQNVTSNIGLINLDQSSDVLFSASTGVPEPESWVMMLGGLGFVGGILRRRKKILVKFATL